MDESSQLPSISVVIPVFNAGGDLEKCLAAITASDFPVHECIVVDDGSTDGCTRTIEHRDNVKLLRMERQGGPGLARNHGAENATGDILFFTDADVLLHPDALGKAARTFAENPEVSAVFGSYDQAPGHPSLLSRYRNLYHHWNHQVGSEDASTFWTGCGAVRRSVFLELGGFSRDYARPSIEDIEFGYRLRSAGHRTRLIKDMQGTHLKEWTLIGMLRTDLFQRGIPWVVLLRRYPDMPADLNLSWMARLATVLSGLILLFVVLLVPGHPVSLGLWPWILVPLLAIAGIVWIQRDFFRLVTRLHGPGFGLAVVPLQILFFITCGLSVPLGYLKALGGGRA